MTKPDLRLVDADMPVALRRIIDEMKDEAEARAENDPNRRVRYNRTYHRHNRS